MIVSVGRKSSAHRQQCFTHAVNPSVTCVSQSRLWPHHEITLHVYTHLSTSSNVVTGNWAQPFSIGALLHLFHLHPQCASTVIACLPRPHGRRTLACFRNSCDRNTSALPIHKLEVHVRSKTKAPKPPPSAPSRRACYSQLSNEHDSIKAR